MLSFPITAERFMKYQEKLVGQTIPDDLAKVVDEWVPIFNRAYELGRGNDETGYNEMLKEIFDLSCQCDVGSPVYSFLMACGRWIATAYAQGSAKNN